MKEHGSQMNDPLVRRIDRRKRWVHILGAHWESGLSWANSIPVSLTLKLYKYNYNELQ